MTVPEIEHGERPRGLVPVSRAYVPAALTLLCGLVASGVLFEMFRLQDLEAAHYAFQAESEMRVRANRTGTR